MVAIDAGCHKWFDLLEDLVKAKNSQSVCLFTIIPSYYVNFHYLFLCCLRMEDLVHFKDATLSFAQHSE